ncbi:MAG TPA: arylsulfatase [Clostridiales bacterium]|nr:arylsulfatase [Clostridiales bacterium]
MSDTRPNVVLIMADQLRADCLGCYGNTVIETEFIDFLASEGTVFENAYSPSPSCVPARTCLMTGMNQWNTGIMGMGGGQGKSTDGFLHTLPGELAKAGYHTQGIGKMHFSPQRSLCGFHHTVIDESMRKEEKHFVSDYHAWFEQNKTGDYGPVDHGIPFNSWMTRPFQAPEFLHPTNWTVNQAINFLEKRDPTKPFFLKVSFARPHSPYDPPQWYYDKYKEKEPTEPYMGDWATVHDDIQAGKNPDAWHGRIPIEKVMDGRRGYYGSIHHVDHQIGRLMQFMSRYMKNEMQNTLFIFTSDHGDMLGDHFMWRKTYAYEGSARIPLIVKLPTKMKTKQVAVNDKPVTLYDIMPTVLEATGVQIPKTVDGLSLLPLTQDRDVPWRDVVHGEHSTCYSQEEEMQFVTDGKYKYIWFPRTGREQFFRLTEDRSESKDLICDPDYSDKREEYKGKLIEILRARNAGLVDDEGLVVQTKPIISPEYAKRVGV